MLVSIQNFKKCLSRWATGVSIITTKSDSELVGTTISSLTSVSLEPALVLFCLDKKSLSHEVFTREESFLANILAEDQIIASKEFASHDKKKWDNIDISHSPNFNLPILQGSIAYLECKNYANYDGGDHTIIVGQVINLEILNDSKPLLHYRSQYSFIK